MVHRQPPVEQDDDLALVVRGHGPCTYLLLSLVVLLFIYPYLKENTFSKVVLGLLYSAVLIGGAYAIGRDKRKLGIALGLAICAMGFQSAYFVTENIWLHRSRAVIYILFLLYAIGEVLAYILKKGPITADKLHGALAGYIMLALLWAFLYDLIESFLPGSFLIGGARLGEPREFMHLLYFSFTTLTTTGFGDITPATDQARSFVIIEEFAGVFFVGVLIARLAGLYPPLRR
jgi:membrane protein CcdC involved in cytochrome C biogenesis